MGKKKKGDVVVPLIRGPAIAWHSRGKDGITRVNYTVSAVKNGFKTDFLEDWSQLPAEEGVRTPIAWYIVGRSGKMLDIEYAEAPSFESDSSTKDDEIMKERADGENEISKGDDEQETFEAQFPLLNSSNKMKVTKEGHVGTSASAPKQDVAHVSDEDNGNLVTDDGVKQHVMAPTKETKIANVPRTNAWTNGSKKIFMNTGLGGKLVFSPPSSNKVSITISEGLSKQSVWGWALLGQYVGFRPAHYLINDMMKAWPVKAKYRVEEGWFIFSFASEDDQEKVLMGGPYFINGRPMILKHIPDKFSFNRRDIATIPLWVRIFGLSRTFWTADILGRIASHIGNPLFMDPVTDGRKRGAYARVLVEINFAKPVTREIMLEFDDGVALACKFLVENEPKYCKECCSFGHNNMECSFITKKSGGNSDAGKGIRNEDSAALENAKNGSNQRVDFGDKRDVAPKDKNCNNAPQVKKHGRFDIATREVATSSSVPTSSAIVMSNAPKDACMRMEENKDTVSQERKETEDEEGNLKIDEEAKDDADEGVEKEGEEVTKDEEENEEEENSDRVDGDASVSCSYGFSAKKQVSMTKDGVTTVFSPPANKPEERAPRSTSKAKKKG